MCLQYTDTHNWLQYYTATYVSIVHIQQVPQSAASPVSPLVADAILQH